MATVEVGFAAEDDREPLLDVLKASADYPHHMLGYLRRRGGLREALISRRSGLIVGVLTGTYNSDLRQSGDFAAFAPPPSPHGFLSRVHVHESARGVGVGRALVETYGEEARARGCTFLGGNIDLSSEPSARRAFFERLGFTIDDLGNFGARTGQVLRRARSAR